MSLLRALRAYVGLGPDEEYDELGKVRGQGGVRTRSGGYLDDLEPLTSVDDRGDKRPEEPDVIDITTARIDARRADGSVNHSRVRTGKPIDRRQRLDQNQQLVDELSPAVDEPLVEPPAEEAVGSEPPPDESEGAIVRSIESARSRPKTLNPESFADAKEMGDEFKRGVPVVVNLQGLDRDLVRRLVDFASGICYALDGSMEKLAPQVFLLTPDGLAVSDDDRRRIEQRGYAR